MSRHEVIEMARAKGFRVNLHPGEYRGERVDVGEGFVKQVGGTVGSTRTWRIYPYRVVAKWMGAVEDPVAAFASGPAGIGGEK